MKCEEPLPFLKRCSDGVLSVFAGSNTNRFLDRKHKDLSITKFAGARRLDDYAYGIINKSRLRQLLRP